MIIYSMSCTIICTFYKINISLLLLVNVHYILLAFTVCMYVTLLSYCYAFFMNTARLSIPTAILKGIKVVHTYVVTYIRMYLCFYKI